MADALTTAIQNLKQIDPRTPPGQPNMLVIWLNALKGPAGQDPVHRKGILQKIQNHLATKYRTTGDMSKDEMILLKRVTDQLGSDSVSTLKDKPAFEWMGTQPSGLPLPTMPKSGELPAPESSFWDAFLQRGADFIDPSKKVGGDEVKFYTPDMPFLEAGDFNPARPWQDAKKVAHDIGAAPIAAGATVGRGLEHVLDPVAAAVSEAAGGEKTRNAVTDRFESFGKHYNKDFPDTAQGMSDRVMDFLGTLFGEYDNANITASALEPARNAMTNAMQGVADWNNETRTLDSAFDFVKGLFGSGSSQQPAQTSPTPQQLQQIQQAIANANTKAGASAISSGGAGGTMMDYLARAAENLAMQQQMQANQLAAFYSANEPPKPFSQAKIYSDALRGLGPYPALEQNKNAPMSNWFANLAKPGPLGNSSQAFVNDSNAMRDDRNAWRKERFNNLNQIAQYLTSAYGNDNTANRNYYTDYSTHRKNLIGNQYPTGPHDTRYKATEKIGDWVNDSNIAGIRASSGSGKGTGMVKAEIDALTNVRDNISEELSTPSLDKDRKAQLETALQQAEADLARAKASQTNYEIAKRGY